MNTQKISPIILHHYIRTAYRFFLLLLFSLYLLAKKGLGPQLFLPLADHGRTVLSIIWLVFMCEMLLRHLPSKIESPGCQKIFKENYIPGKGNQIRIQDNNALMLVAICWSVANLFFALLYNKGILGWDHMLLLSLLYSMGDMVCILVFCPFQKIFLKNKCCSHCRIYNWDYPFMFTPMLFAGGFFGWSLSFMAFTILLRWELTFCLHPERFSADTNAYIGCKDCTEKICRHRLFP